MAESGLLYNLYPAAKRGTDKAEVITWEMLIDDEERKLNIELQEFIKNILPNTKHLANFDFT